MKHLGIDYGTKRIGLAVSNTEGTVSFPKETIPNTSNTLQTIISVIESESVQKVVVGKSLDAWGNDNNIQKEIEKFIHILESALAAIDIVQQDERGSSIAAASHLYSKGNIANKKWTGKDNAKKREHNDAHAAAIILQRYLDRY